MEAQLQHSCMLNTNYISKYRTSSTYTFWCVHLLICSCCQSNLCLNFDISFTISHYKCQRQTTADHKWQTKSFTCFTFLLSPQPLVWLDHSCVTLVDSGCRWTCRYNTTVSHKTKVTYAANNAAVSQAQHTHTVESQSFWTCCFNLLWLVPVNWDEATWLAS